MRIVALSMYVLRLSEDPSRTCYAMSVSSQINSLMMQYAIFKST